MLRQPYGSWALILLLIAASSTNWTNRSSQSASPLLGTGHGIDHVGVAVRDLNAAVEVYRDRLGFTISGEGKHPSGTANAGIQFQNHDYLELITVYDPARAAKGDADLMAFLDKHQGALFLGLQVSSIDTTASYLRAKNFQINGPEEGTWVPDGVTEKVPPGWKDVDFKKPAVTGDTIFFIQYINGAFFKRLRAKYPQLREDPAKRTHANGAWGIYAVWMSVKDLEEATKAYEAVGFRRGKKMALPAIEATGQEMQAGNGVILLVSPTAPDGATAKFIADRRESVMGMSLEVENIGKTQSVLKSRLHRDLSVYVGPCGKSILVPADLAMGAWIEFFEKSR